MCTLKSFPVIALTCLIVLVGCQVTSKQDTQAADGQYAEKLTLSEIRLDVRTDPKTSVEVITPSERDPKDRKFHFKILAKQSESSLQRTPADTTKAVGPTLKFSTQPNRTPPPAPVKSVFRWEEKYGRPSEDCDEVINVGTRSPKNSHRESIAGVCELSGEIQCWDLRGEVDDSLTSEIRSWRKSFTFDSLKDRRLNKLVVLRKPLKGQWLTEWADMPQLDWNRSEQQSTEKYEMILFGFDEPVQEMPLYLSYSELVGRSAPFTLSESNPAKLGKYKIELMANDSRNYASSFAAVLRFTPALSPNDSIRAIWDDGGESFAWGDIHSQQVMLRPGIKADRMTADSHTLPTPSKGRPARYRLVSTKREKILWKYIPLTPKPQASAKTRRS